MTATRRGFLGAAALAAGLALAEEGRAQTPLPGGFNLEGSAEAGVRFFIDEPPPEQLGKFEEYRDFNNGLFLQDLRLRLFRPDEKYSFDFGGRQWGLSDQEYYLGAERLGLFRFDFGWNQIPHILSTSARLLAAQPEPGVFVLSLPRPPLTDYNSARRLDQVGFQTDVANILFKLTPTPEIDLIGEYTRMWKHGDRPFSIVFGSPGSNFYEVLQPINSYTHDVRLRATLAKPDYQLQFDYGFSLYENSFTAVRADNPCFGNLAFCSSGDANSPAPATGQASLAPDNFANTFSLSGGVNVPWWRTRLTGNFTYSWWHQNQAFLPQTINPALASLPEVRLPQSSLNGNVQIFLVNMGAVSRPLRQLTLTGKYRFYSYNDWSDAPTFAELVQNDKSLLEGRQAKRLDYNRQDASLDGRWRFNEAVALTMGGGWEQWNRSAGREVPQTNEVFGKVALDVVPYDWLNGRISYKPSFRRATSYNTGARETTVVLEDDPATTAQSPLLRKYDEADRNLQQINLMATATPFGRYSPVLETLSVSPNFTWKWADYPDSPLGLQKARRLVGRHRCGVEAARAVLGLRRVHPRGQQLPADLAEPAREQRGDPGLPGLQLGHGDSRARRHRLRGLPGRLDPERARLVDQLRLLERGEQHEHLEPGSADQRELLPERHGHRPVLPGDQEPAHPDDHTAALPLLEEVERERVLHVRAVPSGQLADGGDRAVHARRDVDLARAHVVRLHGPHRRRDARLSVLSGPERPSAPTQLLLMPPSLADWGRKVTWPGS